MQISHTCRIFAAKLWHADDEQLPTTKCQHAHYISPFIVFKRTINFKEQ